MCRFMIIAGTEMSAIFVFLSFENPMFSKKRKIQSVSISDKRQKRRKGQKGQKRGLLSSNLRLSLLSFLSLYPPEILLYFFLSFLTLSQEKSEKDIYRV